MENRYTCGICTVKTCSKGTTDYPINCPTNDEKETIAESIDIYRSDVTVNRIMDLANNLAKDDSGEFRSRAEEIVTLVDQMSFKTIGIAFCISMSRQVKQFIKMFSEKNIKIVSVCCKAGGIGIDEIGINAKPSKFIASCNPITQAEIMNKENTELNIIVGLCVGHDIIFNKYSNAFVTTLVAKDRKHSHNPVKHFD